MITAKLNPNYGAALGPILSGGGPRMAPTSAAATAAVVPFGVAPAATVPEVVVPVRLQLPTAAELARRIGSIPLTVDVQAGLRANHRFGGSGSGYRRVDVHRPGPTVCRARDRRPTDHDLGAVGHGAVGQRVHVGGHGTNVDGHHLRHVHGAMRVRAQGDDGPLRGGAATIVVDNTTGWADPNRTDPPGELTVRPGRQIRFGVDHAVYGRRVLFRGFVDAMTPTYLPNGTDTVDLACINALGEVNRAKLKPLAAAVGDGETADVRVTSHPRRTGWATTARDILPSAEALNATDLGGQVADMLGVTADSAAGVVFGDTLGQPRVRPTTGRRTFPRLRSTGRSATSRRPTCVRSGGSDVPHADITTRAIFGRDLETAQVADDVDGMTRYGNEPYERTDLLTKSDTSLAAMATRVLRTRASATAPRVRSVSLDASTAGSALDLMATVDVYRPSRYRCRLQYAPPRGLVFDDQYFATGVAHDLTPSAWSLALNLDVAAPYAAAGGRWDGTYWDQSTWTGDAPCRRYRRRAQGAFRRARRRPHLRDGARPGRRT